LAPTEPSQHLFNLSLPVRDNAQPSALRISRQCISLDNDVKGGAPYSAPAPFSRLAQFGVDGSDPHKGRIAGFALTHGLRIVVCDLHVGLLRRLNQFCIVEAGYSSAIGIQADLGPSPQILQAQVFVPSRSIGFIQQGQRVRLLYDAFPHEHFGTSYGVVDRISATVLLPEDIGEAVSGLKEPVYRVSVIPDRRAVTVDGRDRPLLPGMAFTADIILKERGFLDFVLDPLRAAQGRILGK